MKNTICLVLTVGISLFSLAGLAEPVDGDGIWAIVGESIELPAPANVPAGEVAIGYKLGARMTDADFSNYDQFVGQTYCFIGLSRPPSVDSELPVRPFRITNAVELTDWNSSPAGNSPDRLVELTISGDPVVQKINCKHVDSAASMGFDFHANYGTLRQALQGSGLKIVLARPRSL